MLNKKIHSILIKIFLQNGNDFERKQKSQDCLNAYSHIFKTVGGMKIFLMLVNRNANSLIISKLESDGNSTLVRDKQLSNANGDMTLTFDGIEISLIV